MISPSLSTDDGLREALTKLSDPATWSANDRVWLQNLTNTLSRVRAAGVAQRSTREFQQFLCENNFVANVGRGNLPLRTALDDDAFREWLAATSMKLLPESTGDRYSFLEGLYEQLQTRLRALLPPNSDTPHLKILRVLAALYPNAMTAVANRASLAALAQAMNAGRNLGPAQQQVWIRQRIDSILGLPADTPGALAVRMIIPWLLYEQNVQAVPAPPPTPEVRRPLPAIQRQPGITAIRDKFPGVLRTLDFVGDGTTGDALMVYLRSLSPELQPDSLNVIIGTLKNQLGVIRQEGDQFFRTALGERLAATGDPNELADWLLTRVLGIDHVIAALRNGGPLPAQDLVAVLRQAHPGWSTDFASDVMLSWLRSFGVIELDSNKHQALTEMGRRWAGMIHWTPEARPAAMVRDHPTDAPVPDKMRPAALIVPVIDDIIAKVQQSGNFEAALIARLHAGLWAHPRRHFAILTGLSGSGKTLLAHSYAKAISGETAPLILSVPPGWHDPGALLGYKNPLLENSYTSTPFLDYLINASRDSERPCVVVLDEMNLSHPEQYMAPLLSAMETGKAIHLHSDDEISSKIPREVPYPSNLVLIGTVNMDETTHGLSDKVLDRAFVTEFWKVDLDDYRNWERATLSPEQSRRVRQLLDQLMAVLSPARLHFGWRVVDDVLDYLEQAATMKEHLPFDRALDDVIGAKILPKLRGENTTRVCNALEGCRSALTAFGLVQSGEKVAELLIDLTANGTARFWR